MDPLSVIAVVAAVFQFADFGGKLLHKTWERLKTADQQREAAELTAAAQRLTELYNGVRDKSSTLAPHDGEAAEFAAEAQLHQLCDECSNITVEFQDVLNRIKTRRAGKIKAFAAMAQPRFQLAGIWSAPKIAEMRERLNQVRQQIMAAILFALWEASKRTSRRELYYSQQLKDMTEALDQLEDQQKLEGFRMKDMSPVILTDALRLDEQGMTEEPRRSNKVAKALDPSLVPLFDTLQTSSLSARVIRSEIVTTLQGESVAAKTIRRELFTTLWSKDWSPQSQSMEGLVLDVLAREITATICKSLRFETVEAREESIADSFDKTYDWIFSKRPKLQDEKALWPSFPEWLTSSTASRYWITGKPGSGKSTMMKYIIGHEHLKMHLKKWADPLPIIVTSYYAWHSGLTLQKSLEGLKRTLLLQAIYKNRELARVIAPRRWAFLLALRNGGHPLPPWEPWEIDESFAKLLSECGKSMMLALFIDGLDEFETQPSEIIRLIQDMVADCPKGLKLCVASRPWNEFDDAFTDGPRLQMHLLTEQDMTNFMDSMLSGNRGFLEVQEVYPEEVAQLREEIVVKANGVFLWVSLVVRDLLLSVSEGASIADLQATLNALPPGLSSLYDAIWARIPPRNLVDASFMMQVLRAAHLPMRWLLMWVADEARTVRIDLNSRPAAGTWKAAAWKNLKRRLASRTRGILEITMESYTLSAGGGQVDFAHRTARDWAVQPHIWERICSAGKNIPDPYLALLRAEAIILSDERERSQMTYDRQWWLVTRALWYASRVKDTPENSEDLVQALDDLNLAAVGLKWQPPADAVKQRHERWALPGWARDSLNTFPGMTGQFAIMPYIREKIRSQPRLLCQQLTRNTLGLLENVVFGFKYYLPPSYYTLDGFCPEVPLSQRLEAVQFLLKQGAKLSDARCHVGMVPLRDLVRRLATDQAKLPYHIEVSEEEKNYFAKILQCIDERDLKSKLKSMSVRVRFALVK